MECIRSYEEIKNLSDEEKLELYEQAKEAYYSEEEIMTDQVFDELEETLGLSNVSYVGTHHSENYQVKHPFLMGSLSKVQVKYKDKETHYIDWKDIKEKLLKYFESKKNSLHLIASPKYDGCSFETVFDAKSGNLLSASTRGDGKWGKDIMHIIKSHMRNYPQYWTGEKIHALQEAASRCNDNYDIFVIRGEILVPISTFKEKYSKDFKNPRSFVSGVIGADYDESDAMQMSQYKDLTLVCYDYRLAKSNEVDYVELDIEPQFPGMHGITHTFDTSSMFDEKCIEEIYWNWSKFRNEQCDLALDGFVIKPLAAYRNFDPEAYRPSDCVAVKFLPEITTTKIIGISWNLGKTGEYFPTAICEKVFIGDKDVTRCSLFNYNYMKKHQVGIGSEIEVSLAGDIIPFCYSVITHSDNFDLPESVEIKCLPNVKGEIDKDTLHLMKIMTEDEYKEMKFLASVTALNIVGVGPVAAKKLYDITHVDNVILLMDKAWNDSILMKLGAGRQAAIIANAIMDRKKTLSLQDIIMSMSIAHCGQKTSEVVANYIVDPDSTDWSGVSSDVIQWATDKDSKEISSIFKYAKTLGIKIPTKEEIDAKKEASAGKLKVIMTGEPSNTSYKTKKLWLLAHPQFQETTSWKEVNILFTNDLNASSGKMKKAAKAGVEIRLYED